jgi:hypothetical protein
MVKAEKFLDRLNDLIVEDLLNTPDDELWAEFVEDWGSEEAALAELERIKKSRYC